MFLKAIPLFIIKEAIDNFLDKAEDQRVDPIIDIQMDHGTGQQVNLFITCNTHYSTKATRVVYSAEFGERVSTKTFVKLPSCGLFGMASKTIQALPYTLSLRYGVGLPEQPPIVISTAYGAWFTNLKWVPMSMLGYEKLLSSVARPPR